MSIEHRQHPRVDVRLSAEITREDGVFTALTRNLSAGGAALASERELHEGEHLRLALFLVVDGIEDARTPPLVVAARVQWTGGQADDGSYSAGVKFEGISDAQKQWLERFLAHTGH